MLALKLDIEKLEKWSEVCHEPNKANPIQNHQEIPKKMVLVW